MLQFLSRMWFTSRAPIVAILVNVGFLGRWVGTGFGSCVKPCLIVKHHSVEGLQLWIIVLVAAFVAIFIIRHAKAPPGK